MNHRKFLALATMLLLTILVGCSGGGEEPAEPAQGSGGGAGQMVQVDTATAATITGKVTFSGDKPRIPTINMSVEASCASAHGGPIAAENFVMNDNGTLRNAFVYVKHDFGGSFPTPSDAVVLDQKNCVYSPHVAGAMAGQTVRFVNSDTVTHNVHPVPTVNREWNESQPAQGDDIERAFARPEMGIEVKCNVHPWMKSYLHIMSHPYFAVTGADGTFTIGNLPPGEYTVVVWQESLGETEMQVTVGDSETKAVDFELTKM